MITSRTFSALIPAILLVALSGCSGGGGGGSSAPLAPHVGVYVTDAFSSDYSSVVVTLYQIEVSTDGSNFTTVYSSPGGTSVDVAQLSSVVQLLGTVTVPQGTYIQTRVTFSDQITVIPTGSSTSSTLQVSSTAATITGGKAIVVINTPQTITPSSNLVIDFDLAAFQVVSGKVVCAIQQGNPTKVTTDADVASVVGTVTDLTATTFTLTLPNGDSIPVTYSSGTILQESGGGTPVLANGAVVRVVGPCDPTAHTITATRIEIGVSINAPVSIPTPPIIEHPTTTGGTSGGTAGGGTSGGTSSGTTTGGTDGFPPPPPPPPSDTTTTSGTTSEGTSSGTTGVGTTGVSTTDGTTGVGTTSTTGTDGFPPPPPSDTTTTDGTTGVGTTGDTTSSGTSSTTGVTSTSTSGTTGGTSTTTDGGSSTTGTTASGTTTGGNFPPPPPPGLNSARRK